MLMLGNADGSSAQSAWVEPNATKPIHPWDKYVLSVDEAVAEFSDRLIDKWVHGYPAIEVCIQCWWMKCAGLGGLIADMAYPPGQQSGTYKRHLRKVLGLDALADRRLDTLAVPSTDQHLGTRIEHVMKVLNPHEAIND